ncbi:hypothetical protein ACIRPS_14665 [Streptomyces griseoviridis]
MWTSVSKLSVTIETGEQKCTIYGNSLNMIGVVVSVQPTDDNGDPVQVDSSTLLDNTWLIDYVDGSTLNWYGSSEWSYTDSPNEFHTIPGGSRAAEVVAADDGTPQVKFYVYCSAAARLRTKSIGVRVRTASGERISSSQNGDFHSSVVLSALESFFYGRGDINWEYERAETYSGDASDVYNFSLTCAKNGFYFKTFSVRGCCTDYGYDGLAGWILANSWKDFYGAYVWYREPHRRARETIINFPGDWSDDVTVYDDDTEKNSRGLGFTWAHNHHGGGGTWDIPNGPMTYWWQYYETTVVAYDQYGNSGKFWVDTRNINPDYSITATDTVTENAHGRFDVHTEPGGTDVNASWSGPRLDIYDYNPN